MRRQVVLTIMDGIGLTKKHDGNAFYHAIVREKFKRRDNKLEELNI